MKRGGEHIALRALLVVSLTLSLAGSAPAGASEDWSRVVAEILGPSTLEENLGELMDEIGGRVSGSEANRRSVGWAVEAFRERVGPAAEVAILSAGDTYEF